MNLEKVTFTGVDATTNLDTVNSLIEQHPYIEFGVLLSLSKMGKENRYPTLEVIKKITDNIPKKNLSIHMCGKVAREIVLGKISTEVYDTIINKFTRMQINGRNHVCSTSDMSVIITLLNIEEIIFQYPSNAPWGTLSNARALIDYSGGTGQTLDKWPEPPLLTTKCGYAGGLTPENFKEKIKELHEVLPDKYNTWVDMESGVRTVDNFDLYKVRIILKELCNE
jgi:phosphoribosylanthranilate isomerase